MPRSRTARGERLAIVFGDQLDRDAPLVRALAPEDTVLLMEVASESTAVPSHIQRTVLFLSAMRHFAESLRERGVRVRYVALDDPANTHSFEGEIDRAIADLLPRELRATLPGAWRVKLLLESAAKRHGLPLAILPDTHFLTTPEEFAAWAEGRRSLTMEFFYREQRRRSGLLMVGTGRDAKPEGDTWNFDKENRLPFGKGGPTPPPPAPLRFAPDEITRQTIVDARRHLPELPGRLDEFSWPVTRDDARRALADFVAHRLANFGPYEDAMWRGEPFLHHSTLSAALNLHLLTPRECCDAAVAAFRTGAVPLQSAEAFVRQLIGWREFIRGVYWLEGREYVHRNALESRGELPSLYWDGKTEMACMRECVGEVLERGFGHHIQRLMVTGNYALLSGVDPRQINDWYLGMFVDGVEWVTTPNVVGMVMHADRRDDAPSGTTGLVGTKPYAASGRYIDRMSNYCRDCRYDPTARSGPRACPFTVLYWDFLIRQRERLGSNQRMTMILRNVDRMSAETRTQITIDASAIRRG